MKFKAVNYIRLNSKIHLKYCSDNIFCLLDTNDSEQNEPFCGQICPLSIFFYQLPTLSINYNLWEFFFVVNKSLNTQMRLYGFEWQSTVANRIIRHWINFNFASAHFIQYRRLNQGILKGEVSPYHWPPVWLVWISLFYK